MTMNSMAMGLDFKSKISRSKIRDKRLVIPSLYIDLRDKVHKTKIWVPGELIVRNYQGMLGLGEEFSGVLKLGGNPKVFLFDGRVKRLDLARQRLAVSFSMPSSEGNALLGKYYSVKERNPGAELPTIFLSVAYRTINWSLSGFLISGYDGKLALGQYFSGMIRLAKTRKVSFFRAEVKRHIPRIKGIGAQFVNMSPDTFNLFEIAMQKSEVANS